MELLREMDVSMRDEINNGLAEQLKLRDETITKLRSDLADSERRRAESVLRIERLETVLASTAPGHTDLMITPEAIDEVIKRAALSDRVDEIEARVVALEAKQAGGSSQKTQVVSSNVATSEPPAVASNTLCARCGAPLSGEAASCFTVCDACEWVLSFSYPPKSGALPPADVATVRHEARRELIEELRRGVCVLSQWEPGPAAPDEFVDTTLVAIVDFLALLDEAEKAAGP